MDCVELRKASWSEVVSLFHAHGDERQARRNANGWAERYGVPHRDYSALPVTLQAWRHDKIGAVLDDMATVEPRMIVTELPRCYGLPAAVIRFGDRYGMIDGKHRANQWRKWPGMYAVLVVG